MARAKELIAAKKKADAPIMTYKGLDVTQGAGRFGPFLKWNELFINIPKRYNPDRLSKDDMTELIQAKEEKEANRYIQRFSEEKIDVEQGRWGPFIRYKKKSINFPKDKDGNRMTREAAAELTLEECITAIQVEMPTAFKPKKKKAPAKKKPAAKKKAPVKKK
jgi:DNA topoisomerase-1